MLVFENADIKCYSKFIKYFVTIYIIVAFDTLFTKSIRNKFRSANNLSHVSLLFKRILSSYLNVLANLVLSKLTLSYSFEVLHCMLSRSFQITENVNLAKINVILKI